MAIGPNISSGVLNLFIKYSNELPSLKISFTLREIRLFATPGGPKKNILSPDKVANRANLIASSLSNKF